MKFESLSQEYKKRTKKGPGNQASVHNQMRIALDASARQIDANVKKHADERRETLSEKAFRTETLSHGNIELDMVGVAHISETLPLFRNQIEAKVQNTDFTILETGVETVDPGLARG